MLPRKEHMRALIIVDVQNDFCPGGALETVKGATQAQSIAEYTALHGKNTAALQPPKTGI